MIQLTKFEGQKSIQITSFVLLAWEIKSRGFNTGRLRSGNEIIRPGKFAADTPRASRDRGIASMAIAGNRFIVAQIRRGAARLSSLGYRRYVSSFSPSHPSGFQFLIPAALPFAAAPAEAQNYSSSPAFRPLPLSAFRFSLSLFPRCGIEAKLLLMLVWVYGLSPSMRRNVQTRFESHSHGRTSAHRTR